MNEYTLDELPSYYNHIIFYVGQDKGYVNAPCVGGGWVYVPVGQILHQSAGYSDNRSWRLTRHLET